MSQLPGYGGGVPQASPGTSYGVSSGSSTGYSFNEMRSIAQTSYANVMAGYANLKSDIGKTLGYGGTPWGVAAPAAQAIADLYAQNTGNTAQQMISAGLGNSTVLPSMQRGNVLDAAKAYGNLGAQLAQTYAGYQGQVGLAQLAYMGAYHPFSYGYSTQGAQQGSVQAANQGYGGGGGVGYGGVQESPTAAAWLNSGNFRGPSGGGNYAPWTSDVLGFQGSGMNYGTPLTMSTGLDQNLAPVRDITPRPVAPPAAEAPAVPSYGGSPDYGGGGGVSGGGSGSYYGGAVDTSYEGDGGDW
jgi:hypothetical protein